MYHGNKFKFLIKFLNIFYWEVLYKFNISYLPNTCLFLTLYKENVMDFFHHAQFRHLLISTSLPSYTAQADHLSCRGVKSVGKHCYRRYLPTTIPSSFVNRILLSLVEVSAFRSIRSAEIQLLNFSFNSSHPSNKFLFYLS